MKRLLILLSSALVLAAPLTVQAQQVHRPIVGSQMFTLGVEAQGGAVVDWIDDDLGLSPAAGARARIGLHHVISDRLSMNAEFAPGATYFAPHPVAPDGAAPSQTRLDWHVALLARRFRIGLTSGFTFAGGIYYRQTHLAGGRLLQLGGDLRLGRFVWTSDETFFIVELGLRGPFIEGLNVSQFTADDAVNIPDQWTYPQASLGIQWAF